MAAIASNVERGLGAPDTVTGSSRVAEPQVPALAGPGRDGPRPAAGALDECPRALGVDVDDHDVGDGACHHAEVGP